MMLLSHLPYLDKVSSLQAVAPLRYLSKQNQMILKAGIYLRMELYYYLKSWF